MKISIVEVQRAINVRVDEVGLHGPKADRTMDGHLDEMRRCLNAAGRAWEDAVTTPDPAVAAIMGKLALHEVRDLIVAGVQCLAQHGVPLGKRPEQPTSKGD